MLISKESSSDLTYANIITFHVIVLFVPMSTLHLLQAALIKLKSASAKLPLPACFGGQLLWQIRHALKTPCGLDSEFMLRNPLSTGGLKIMLSPDLVILDAGLIWNDMQDSAANVGPSAHAQPRPVSAAVCAAAAILAAEGAQHGGHAGGDVWQHCHVLLVASEYTGDRDRQEVCAHVPCAMASAALFFQVGTLKHCSSTTVACPMHYAKLPGHYPAHCTQAVFNDKLSTRAQEARKRKWCAFNPLRFDFDLQAPGVLPSW
eukprot:1144379-Pelagomonas_calceolata.AAC.3